jgi:hypothetical protein
VIVHNNNKNYNSGGGSVTMKNKYANKFKSISSSSMGSFSINGVNNRNIYANIGNPNQGISDKSHVEIPTCKTPDPIVKKSVRNTRAYIDSKLMCSPLNSADCYKKVNKVLIDAFNNGAGVNKFLTMDNNIDIFFQTNRINRKYGACDISKNIVDTKCYVTINQPNSRVKTLFSSPSISKDLKIPSDSFDYSMYNFLRFSKCNNNPPNAKTIRHHRC